MFGDRLLSWLERTRLLDLSWWSLVRILAWMVVALVAAGVMVPDRGVDPAASGSAEPSYTPVRSVSVPRGDPRGFLPPREKDVFKIAWIAGSSIEGSDSAGRTFVPIEMSPRLQSIDGRPVAIDLYFLSGMRVIDEYVALLAAVDAGPDLVVLTLNPFWALNDRAVQGWDNLDGKLGVNLIRSPGAWPLLSTLVGPADLMLGAVAQAMDVVDDRYHWGERLRDRIGDLTFLDEAQPTPAENPSELDEIAAMQIPVLFWDRYAPTMSDDVTGMARVVASFERAGEARSGMNQVALDGMFDALAESDIPAYVYIAQVDDSVLADEAGNRAVAHIERQLERIAARADGTAVVFRPNTVSRAVPGMRYKDRVHLVDVTPVTDFLTRDICNVLRLQGLDPECELTDQ